MLIFPLTFYSFVYSFVTLLLFAYYLLPLVRWSSFFICYLQPALIAPFEDFWERLHFKSLMILLTFKLIVQNNHSYFCDNPFVPNAPFLYPLKTSENRKVFWCFQAAEKGCTGSNGSKFTNIVNFSREISINLKWQCFNTFFCMTESFTSNCCKILLFLLGRILTAQI